MVARVLGGPPVVQLLAHQGGWDEAILVAVPIAGLAGLLWLAARRAARAEKDGAQQQGDD